jgi:LysM repeat protein
VIKYSHGLRFFRVKLSALAPQGSQSYFRGMKRIVLSLLVGFVGFGTPMRANFAQDQAEAAAAIAARQDTEERYQRLSAEIHELQAANAMLQKKLNALSEEIQRIHDESSRSSLNFATKDDLNHFTEKLREVDQKREADNKRILETLEKIAKTPPSSVAKTDQEPTSPPKSRPEKRLQTEKGFWYEVRSKDKLSLIVQAYRQKGVKVTMQQIKEANPDLDANRLLVGQRIFIPDPSAK